MAELTMTSPFRTTPPTIQWGVANRTMPNEAVTADLHVVRPFPGGVLIGVADGIGHGTEAAQASKQAMELLGRNPSAPVEELMQACHEALNNTRGAVMGLASINFSQNKLTWGGVGDVQGVVCRVNGLETETEALLTKKGVLGHDFTSSSRIEASLQRGDVLIVATDGVDPGFTKDLFPRYAPQVVANDIMDQHYNGRDDAVVLVVRYLGLLPQ